MNSKRPRLLVVWHGALVPEYRKPFEYLHRSAFEVTLLVPDRWRQALTGEQQYVPGESESFHTYVEKVRWPDYAVLHSYPRLTEVLSEVSPQLLLAIEEPYSLITARLLRWCRKRGIPFAFHTYQDLYKQYPPPFCWTQWYVLRKSDLALVANRTVEQVLRRKCFEGPVELLPYGIDPERFKPMARESSPTPTPKSPPAQELNSWAGQLKIGYIGRFVPEKGIDVLIDAARLLQFSARIVLAGDGPEREQLVSLAEKNGLSGHIEWHGAIPHDRLPDFYRGLDILVLPSRTTRNWQEQFGRVLVEAMACGTAVVGSSCGAIPEVIGDAGVVFPEGDANILADRLNELAKSPEKRTSLAERGTERVRRMYTHRQQAAVLHNSLLRILENSDHTQRSRN